MPPKEKFQFERELSKGEFKELRLPSDIDNRRGLRGKPENTLGRHRLFIHEVFLASELRDKSGGKPITLVKITVRILSCLFALTKTNSNFN